MLPTSTPAPLAPLLAAGNTISGRLSDEVDDRPVIGADVALYTSAGAPITQFQVRTGSDGRFVFADVPDGSYKVYFHAQWVGYDNEWWEDKPDQAFATPIEVASGSSEELRAELRSSGAVVRGTVTGDGAPIIGGVFVGVYPAGTDNFIQGRWTDANGEFAITVPAGSYEVQFSPDLGQFRSEWWNDSPSRQQATRLDLDNRADVTLNAVLTSTTATTTTSSTPPTSTTTTPYNVNDYTSG